MKRKIEQIFDFWALAEKLKATKRWKGVPQMQQKETSADHSWQLCALVFLTIKEFDLRLDELKCLQLALVHDLAEALADDVDSVLIHSGEASQEEKDQNEKKAILKISKSLPAESGKKIKNLWYEYFDKKTAEAKFVYALDKLESIVHLTFKGHQNFHDHDDFMALYCHKAVENVPELKPLHNILQKKLKAEYTKKGWDWKREYNAENVPDGLTEKAEKIVNFCNFGQKLKTTRRWSTVVEMPEKESVAEHSWNLALASFIFANELNLPVNILKSIQLALFHDIAESITGDIDYTYIYTGTVNKSDKHNAELLAIKEITSVLGKRMSTEIFNLWQEYEDAKTEEAKFIKALDKIEGINHMLALSHTCFDHPELIAPYPNAATKNYPSAIPILQELHERLVPEFEKCGWVWKVEYNVVQTALDSEAIG